MPFFRYLSATKKVITILEVDIFILGNLSNYRSMLESIQQIRVF
jgi:hypothetical protein